jgi:hypothetical protein
MPLLYGAPPAGSRFRVVEGEASHLHNWRWVK